MFCLLLRIIYVMFTLNRRSSHLQTGVSKECTSSNLCKSLQRLYQRNFYHPIPIKIYLLGHSKGKTFRTHQAILVPFFFGENVPYQATSSLLYIIGLLFILTT